MTAYPEARQVLDSMTAPHRNAFEAAVRLRDPRLAQRLWALARDDWQDKQSQPLTVQVFARLAP